MTAASLVPQGGFLLALTRAAFVGALLSAGGVLVFRASVMTKVGARSGAEVLGDVDHALRRLTWTSLAMAACGLLGWTVLQTAALAGASRLGNVADALGPVLGRTEFGHLVLLQAALLVAAGVLARLAPSIWGAIAASGAIVAQAGHGHGMAMGGLVRPLFWTDAAHLLAASAWIGGLLPLLLVVVLAPSTAAAQAARWFSPLGKWCVGVLAGSALIQGWVLVGGFRALFGTAYGWVLLAKIGCFGVLFGLAVLNRYALAPALRGGRTDVARRRLVASIGWQTATGLLAVAAAGVLSGLEPGMDMGRGS